jgi:hypothetical protein
VIHKRLDTEESLASKRVYIYAKDWLRIRKEEATLSLLEAINGRRARSQEP